MPTPEQETHDQWLARLDQYLEYGHPAEQVADGAFAFYEAVQHHPITGVRAYQLRDLIETRGLTPPDAYAPLVDLYPAELGADSTSRYVLTDARDPVGPDRVRDGDQDNEASDTDPACGDEPGAVRPDPAAARENRRAPSLRQARGDVLDALTRRLDAAVRAAALARRQPAVDLLAVAALDGYIAALELARLYVTAGPYRKGILHR